MTANTLRPQMMTEHTFITEIGYFFVYIGILLEGRYSVLAIEGKQNL